MVSNYLLLSVKISLIGCIHTWSSEVNPKQPKTENHYNDRLHRDATLTIIDYDNQLNVCDDHHPQFCEFADQLSKIEANSKERLNFDGFANKVWPFESFKPNKVNYKSSQGSPKSIRTSDLQNLDGFVCTEYGFFPDFNNQKMFYHCTPSAQDDGFNIFHKKCPNGLIFNALTKKCEMNQFKSNRNVQAKYSFKKKPETTQLFHCSRTGLFPDKFNESMFWYCERNRKNGFTVTKMICPDDEIFDPVKKSCVLIDIPTAVLNKK